MTARRRVPQRRPALAFCFEHGRLRYSARVGFFDDDTVAELFLDSARPDWTLDALAADAAILTSLLLQHGATPAEIGHALRRCPDGSPASLIGAAVEHLRACGDSSACEVAP
jgi:hypothetical protein